MAEHLPGHPCLRISCTVNPGLIDLLQTILARLDERQTVGEQFTQERLAELGAEFNLADSDWGQLYCMIRHLKE